MRAGLTSRQITPREAFLRIDALLVSKNIQNFVKLRNPTYLEY